MNAEVKKYFEAVPPGRRERLDVLHRLILQLYPQVEISMKYKMPSYTVGDGWVALANQKNYVSLYTCGYHHIEAFKRQHPGIRTGKGCINLRDRDELPLDDIRQVIQHAIEHPKGK